MPSLDELRKWLQGDVVEGLPERDDPDEQVFSGITLDPALMEDCPACDGEGEKQGQCCPACQGLGSVPKEPTQFAKNMREKARTKRRVGKYTLSAADGSDAMLLFGKYKDKQLSDLAKTRDGREYLLWISKNDFPEELLELVRMWYNSGIKQYEHGSMRQI